jgi:hypothetical protein
MKYGHKYVHPFSNMSFTYTYTVYQTNQKWEKREHTILHVKMSGYDLHYIL